MMETRAKSLSLVMTLVLVIGGLAAAMGLGALAPDQAMASGKLKSSYVQTFYMDKGKATIKANTKKAYRVVDGDKLYAATLTKYVQKSGKEAYVPGVVIFDDSGLDVVDLPAANVTEISKKAFKSCKAKVLNVYSLRLTKSGVKSSLKGSSITKVVVPKSCLKKYKKYFSEANCGKKVKVVALSGKLAKYPKGDWVPDYALVGLDTL